jgi:hypothetical protein
VALGLGCTSCYRTSVETSVVRHNAHELRTPLQAEGELATPVWQFRDDAIVTQLKPGPCRATRDWVATEVRTTTRSPRRDLAGIALGVGLVAEVIGAATLDLTPEFYCDGMPVSGNVAPPYARSCEHRDPDNTVAKGLLVTGAVLLLVGTVASLQSTSVEQEVLGERAHQLDKVEPCISSRELAELVLAVRGPAGQLWPVKLTGSAEVAIATRQSPPLPRGVELQLVVFTPPRTERTVLSRGKVLGTFELPSQ